MPAKKTTAKKQSPKWYHDYQAYLDSMAWRDLRFGVMERDGEKCRVCGKTASQVHHHKYPKCYADDCEDNCIAICKECHQRVHGLADKIDPVPYRMFHRRIGVTWENGYGLVLLGSDKCGENTTIVVSESQVEWLVEQMIYIKNYYCEESETPLEAAVEDIKCTLGYEIDQIKRTLQKLSKAGDKDE